jgi:hypothetical protein
MSDGPPFAETDLPRASRVVPAPINTVFLTVADVRKWPAWVPLVLDPVIPQDDDHFLFRVGQQTSARSVTVRLALRTPLHLMAFETDERHQLRIRFRPAAGGTEVEVVVRPNPQMTRLERLRERRRGRKRALWAEATLDALASFVSEAGPITDA